MLHLVGVKTDKNFVTNNTNFCDKLIKIIIYENLRKH